MKIILNESEQASYHKIIQGLFEDSIGGSIDPNLASNEQNTGPSQEPLQPEEQELLVVDSQIRQSNPLLNEINKMIQAKSTVYNNLKNEMESKIVV